VATSEQPVIRTAQPVDGENVHAVFDAAFAPLRRVYRPRGDTQAHESRRARLGTRLVAVLDTSVVGTVQYEVHSKHVHVIGLAVHPTFQGQGVARSLIEHIADLAPGLGRSVLALDTIREAGNVPVLERLGFRVRSEAPTDFFESDLFSQLHEVKMERLAGRAAA